MGEHADVVQFIFVTIFNLAGAPIGLVVDASGLVLLPWTMLLLIEQHGR